MGSHTAVVVCQRKKIYLTYVGIGLHNAIDGTAVGLQKSVVQHAGQGNGTIAFQIFGIGMMGGKHICHLRFQPGNDISLHVINGFTGHIQIDVLGVHGFQTVLRTKIQAAGADHHYQYHGAQDANRSKTGTIALHAVCHGGYGDKMILFIIITFVFL